MNEFLITVAVALLEPYCNRGHRRAGPLTSPISVRLITILHTLGSHLRNTNF